MIPLNFMNSARAAILQILWMHVSIHIESHWKQVKMNAIATATDPPKYTTAMDMLFESVCPKQILSICNFSMHIAHNCSKSIQRAKKLLLTRVQPNDFAFVHSPFRPPWSKHQFHTCQRALNKMFNHPIPSHSGWNCCFQNVPHLIALKISMVHFTLACCWFGSVSGTNNGTDAQLRFACRLPHNFHYARKTFHLSYKVHIIGCTCSWNVSFNFNSQIGFN